MIQFFELKIDVVKANHEENVDAFLSWKLTSQSGRDFKSHSDYAHKIEPRSGDFFVDSDFFVEKGFIKPGRDVVLISIEGERGKNRRLEIAAPVCLCRYIFRSIPTH